MAADLVPDGSRRRHSPSKTGVDALVAAPHHEGSVFRRQSPRIRGRRGGGPSLKLFTTIATLGTPRDVTAQEIRIECFFPADPQTADIFRRWAAARTS